MDVDLGHSLVCLLIPSLFKDLDHVFISTLSEFISKLGFAV